MGAPFEIVAGKVQAWLAPVGTAFPVINVAPGGAWVLLGVAGDKDVSEDGVIIKHTETQTKIRTLGTTMPRKAFRTEEDLSVELTLFDATAEAIAAQLNGGTITTLAGPPAEKTVPLNLGGSVLSRALLIRGVLSPYADSASNLQVDIPLAVQDGELDLTFKKGDPIGLKLRFWALDDANLKIHLPTA